MSTNDLITETLIIFAGGLAGGCALCIGIAEFCGWHIGPCMINLTAGKWSTGAVMTRMKKLNIQESVLTDTSSRC